jgi:hypothetical protein
MFQQLVLKRKPSHPTTVPTTPASKKKIKFESPDNSTAVETKCLTPESPLPQPFSTPIAGTSKEPVWSWNNGNVPITRS